MISLHTFTSTQDDSHANIDSILIKNCFHSTKWRGLSNNWCFALCNTGFAYLLPLWRLANYGLHGSFDSDGNVWTKSAVVRSWLNAFRRSWVVWMDRSACGEVWSALNAATGTGRIPRYVRTHLLRQCTLYSHSKGHLNITSHDQWHLSNKSTLAMYEHCGMTLTRSDDYGSWDWEFLAMLQFDGMTVTRS